MESMSSISLQKNDELLIFAKMGYQSYSGRVITAMDGVWKDHYIIHINNPQQARHTAPSSSSSSRTPHSGFANNMSAPVASGSHVINFNTTNNNSSNTQQSQQSQQSHADAMAMLRAAANYYPVQPTQITHQRQQPQQLPSSTTNTQNVTQNHLAASLAYASNKIAQVNQMNVRFNQTSSANATTNNNAATNPSLLGSLLSLINTTNTTNNPQNNACYTQPTANNSNNASSDVLSQSLTTSQHTQQSHHSQQPSSRHSSLSNVTVSSAQARSPINSNFVYPLQVPYPISSATQLKAARQHQSTPPRVVRTHHNNNNNNNNNNNRNRHYKQQAQQAQQVQQVAQQTQKKPKLPAKLGGILTHKQKQQHLKTLTNATPVLGAIVNTERVSGRKRSIIDLDADSNGASAPATGRSKKKSKHPAFHCHSNTNVSQQGKALELLRRSAAAHRGYVPSLRHFMRQVGLGYDDAQVVLQTYAKERGMPVEELKLTWMTLSAVGDKEKEVARKKMECGEKGKSKGKKSQNESGETGDGFHCKWCSDTMDSANMLFHHYQKLHTEQWRCFNELNQTRT